ncbi:helix-turn-helix domain-containing protein [Kaistia dalseonensis]|uniref:Mor family transcriptional regulator n=1 Tax=Kaistia dalseonensis TaxID=410840 RepID=A0ABU0HCA5_9HYPH|nr:helix-turn-helix domain-containing protein [Kaistia dalseonensis]MCX5497306.1 helix-turn-helix domain-containing protein [Kaistia dalseonensis]MDQ0439943.1 Mor family transcriptional regulator [Kaistia dalseonensis]
MTALPPPTLECRRLVQIMGAEAALALIEWQGGTRYYVPKVISADHKLAQTVGLGPATALVEAYGSSAYKVPVAREWRILVYRQRGLSYSEIARRLVCSQSTIWRVLNANEKTAKQLDLFATL